MSKFISKRSKIFLAGANGMVGKSIKKSLINCGYGLIRNKGEILCPSREELDLFDYLAVKSWFKIKKPDIVILAAAKVGGILANSNKPADFLLENLKIQTNVIEASWLSGVKRFLFLGSSCIYPSGYNKPIKEEYLLQRELEKTNEYYAIAKIAGIKLCDALRKQHNFDAISLMPTNLYGPNDNYNPNSSHVMPALIKKFLLAKKSNLPSVVCWGSGSPLREFLYVEDLADAVVFCLENWNPSSSNAPKDNFGNPLTILNVGTGIDISIKDLAKKIATIIDYQGKIYWDKSKPDGTKRKLLDITRISNLGWKASINLEEGIKRTIKDLF
tara:strand:+ start:1343 stop:2329 length:987 start_codon:yes stop_codon:yes gene_type:complete